MIIDPLLPVLETLERLEQEDPKFASQGAHLLEHFRSLWASCLSKQIEVERLGDANHELRANNAQMCREGDDLRNQQNDQLTRLHAFERSLTVSIT